ncbi:effector-associated domain 2-containing protein [Kineosporia babensis]|uniref:Caspase family protein n=1 Tax=Kineosporia babensis TaxID=499548 RepID=A0A9X1NBX7_9ACTN|nr:caspase family protein [Kineosporia babensis]MCD5310951.1 caspase family protein [Kineosporia babensis]
MSISDLISGGNGGEVAYRGLGGGLIMNYGPEVTAARAQATTLVLVGVEQYSAGPQWDLPGPAADARRFADRFWSQGVLPERTFAFVSALPDSESLWANTPITPRTATRENVRGFLARTVAETEGDLLIVVWGGHGMVGVGGGRHLFTADATASDPLNLDVDAMLALHRSPAITSFRQQLWLVDACQTLYDAAGNRRNLPREDFGVRDVAPGRLQEVLFAASTEESAINLTAQRTGLFSQELLAELHGPAGQWPPDVPALAARLSWRFARLRSDGRARQTPAYLWVKDRTGMEGQLLAQHPSGATAAPPAAELSLAELAPLVDALLAIPEFLGQDFRDEVVSLLRGDISGILARHSRPRADAVSMAMTCARFPGGLPELLEAIRIGVGDIPEIARLQGTIQNQFRYNVRGDY